MKKVVLLNPWTGAEVKAMTWNEIEAWARKFIHYQNRDEWLNDASDAFDNDDGETLGNMIIGS
jgi:hypothetical protein